MKDTYEAIFMQETYDLIIQRTIHNVDDKTAEILKKSAKQYGVIYGETFTNPDDAQTMTLTRNVQLTIKAHLSESDVLQDDGILSNAVPIFEELLNQCYMVDSEYV